MSGLAFGPARMARLDELARFSDEPDRLTRSTAFTMPPRQAAIGR